VVEYPYEDSHDCGEIPILRRIWTTTIIWHLAASKTILTQPYFHAKS